MWGPIRAAIVVAALLGLRSRAQDVEDDNNIWKIPEDTDAGAFLWPRTYPLSFEEGATINISWTTTLKTAQLHCAHQNVTGSRLLTEQYGKSGWFAWTIDGINANLSIPFVFSVMAPSGPGAGYFISTSFYITKKEVAAPSVKPTARSTTSSLSGLPTIATLRPTPTLPTGSDSSRDGVSGSFSLASSGIDKETVIGLTVGLSIAFLVILAGITFILLRRWKRKQIEKTSLKTPSTEETQEYMALSPGVYEGSSNTRRTPSPVELPAQREDAELPVPRNMSHEVDDQDEWVQERK
ncbi:hypothetical protein CC86DRAFT_166945 [Ophiobolus disseminans]|uniref:Mid2 domain-containing protein n=1 Tax=Ophiobolus disseminans TaxID=1469910 RepID=A0A6A7ABZ5_9PLEO|nr:hypothetical protein CC86DRAFT_166945 [Ophiobolus disseminans]